MTSSGSYVDDNTDRTHRSMLRRSLRAGMMTETSGAAVRTSGETSSSQRELVARINAAMGGTTNGNDHKTGATADITRSTQPAPPARRAVHRETRWSPPRVD